MRKSDRNRLYLSLTIEQARNIVDSLNGIIQEVQIDNEKSSLVLENPDIYEPNVVLVVEPD